jgi:hypothetical protein
MNKLNPHEPVLLRVPAHLYIELSETLILAGYDLQGDGNYRKVTAIPNFLRKNYERPFERFSE